MQLERPQSTVHHKREGKAQLETDITPERSLTGMQSNRTNIPRLAHAGDHTGDTEAECNSRSDTDRQLIGLVVDLWTVAAEAALEDEVVGDGDTGVDSQPVGDEVHEVVEDGLEVGVAGDGDGEGDAGGKEGPDEARHALRVARQDLQGQGDGVDVGAVVGDDGQGQDDETELAEAAERLEDGADQAAVVGRVVAQVVLVVVVVEGSGGHDGDAQHLREEQRDDQAQPGGKEDLAAAAVGGLVDGVVGGVAGPAGREAVHGRAEGETAAHFRGADFHGEVDKVARVGEHAQHDEEDDEGRDPAVLFILVDDLVAGESDEQRAEGDDEDTGVARDGAVDSVQQLRAHDGISSGPADAGQDVENGDWVREAMLAASNSI